MNHLRRTFEMVINKAATVYHMTIDSWGMTCELSAILSTFSTSLNDVTSGQAFTNICKVSQNALSKWVIYTRTSRNEFLCFVSILLVSINVRMLRDPSFDTICVILIIQDDGQLSFLKNKTTVKIKAAKAFIVNFKNTFK